jgi:soluble lytic murein transglycosylase-like protein
MNRDWDLIDWMMYFIGIATVALMVLVMVDTVVYANTTEKLYQIRHDVPNQRINNLSSYINEYSKQYNVPENLIIAVIDVESDLKNTYGSHGEVGYMQILSSTFEQVCDYQTTQNKLLYDVEEQIRCSIKYLSELIYTHGFYGALSSYNSGYPTRTNSEYVAKVLNEYNELK